MKPIQRAYQTEEDYRQHNLDHQAEFGYGLFPVIPKDTEELIGDCGGAWL